MRSVIKMGSAKRGFMMILSGTLLAQIITFFLLPIISRLYSPEDFGILTLILSIASLLVPVASMRLDTAMMLPEKNADVRALLFLSLVSTITIASLAGIVMAIVINFRPEIATVPLIPIWLFSTIVLTSLFTLLNRLALRKSGFGEVGKRTILQSIGTGGGQVGFSYFPGGGLGLIFGSLLGRCVGLLPLIRFNREFFGKPDLSLAKQMLFRYWKFPVLFAPSSVLNVFGVQAPLIFVGLWFGAASAGILGMADRIIGVPMALIGRAASQVLDSEIAKKMRSSERNFTKIYLQATWALGAVALIVGLGFFFLAEWAVPLILGNGWEMVGTCVKVMSVTVALRLIATPTGVVIALFEEAAGMLVIDITRTSLTALAMIVITLTQASFLTAVIWLYSALSFVYVITWGFGWYVVRKHST